MASVPIAHFDYREFPPAERLAAFRRVTSAVYEVQPKGRPEDFRVTGYGYRVGSLLFNEAIFSPARFSRTNEHTSRAGSDFLVLQMQLRGTERLEMAFGNARLFPGNIYLRDWSHSFESDATGMHLHSLVIPRHLISRAGSVTAMSPLLTWPVAEPEGGLLFHLWFELIRRLPNIELRQAVSLGSAFLGFIEGLLADATELGGAGSLRSMENFLRMRLRENISVADICRHFHVSRASVYRYFAPHGGVRGFIDRERLNRVRMELLHSDATAVTVAEIAASWGFHEASAFSRRFRRQFGETPSEVLRRPLEVVEAELSDAPQGSGSFQAYANWLSATGQKIG